MQPLIPIAAPGTDSMNSLQERFVESRGAPVLVDGKEIVQMDRIRADRGTVRVSAKAVCAGQGIALKAPTGSITLSNGRGIPLLHIWFDPGLPLNATHAFDCRDGELRVWNIFRTIHPNGVVTEDAWTGNAGMLIVNKQPLYRRYRCSPGTAVDFDPQLDVTVEVIEAR
jgi:hypothetical protein